MIELFLHIFTPSGLHVFKFDTEKDFKIFKNNFLKILKMEHITELDYKINTFYYGNTVILYINNFNNGSDYPEKDIEEYNKDKIINIKKIYSDF